MISGIIYRALYRGRIEMKYSVKIVFVFIVTLALTGCVSREAADAKLVKGCEAGVNAILPEGIQIGEVLSTEATPASQGTNYRHIKLVAIEMGDWLEEEKAYECIFEENFGFLKANHTAAIYQIKTGYKVVGKSGGDILGDVDDFLKLTEAIRKAMYE